MTQEYCALAYRHPIHGAYHDHEYGFPTVDEHVLFERLGLEIMQAGLSSNSKSRVMEGLA